MLRLQIGYTVFIYGTSSALTSEKLEKSDIVAGKRYTELSSASTLERPVHIQSVFSNLTANEVILQTVPGSQKELRFSFPKKTRQYFRICCNAFLVIDCDKSKECEKFEKS